MEQYISTQEVQFASGCALNGHFKSQSSEYETCFKMQFRACVQISPSLQVVQQVLRQILDFF